MYSASSYILKAIKSPTRTNLKTLFEEYKIKTSEILKGYKELEKILDYFDLELTPSINETYELELYRILSLRNKASSLSKDVDDIINHGGENQLVELKESIIIDLNNKKHNPGKKLIDYKSLKLESKVAQEICGFLNSSGGKILFGIRDKDFLVSGCEDDLELVDKGGSLQDKTDLLFKKLCDEHFLLANEVRSNMHINSGIYKKKFVVLIDIFESKKLIFLKKNQLRQNIFYKRIGTNCIPINFEDIANFYDITKKFKD